MATDSDDVVYPYGGPGGEELWTWFGLSYASFLVLPRVLMHAMPDEWQGRMAALLREYDDAFPGLPCIETRVSAVSSGRYARFPKWLLNYRRPDDAEIEGARAGSNAES